MQKTAATSSVLLLILVSGQIFAENKRLANEKPNIIVIMCDQLKATASHLYGNSFCKTPNLGRMADEGTLFENAYTPHPLCVPARVSLWTAQYPHTHGSRRNQTLMPPDAAHAFKQWKALGYKNALIGKNHCFRTPKDLSLFDVWCETVHHGPVKRPPRGMDWVADPANAIEAYATTVKNMNQSPRFGYAITEYPATYYSTGLLTAQALQFLAENKEQPFALWLSYPDPHEPYIAPKRYVDMIPEDVPLPSRRPGEFAGKEVPERSRVLYEILGMDDDREEHIRNQLRVYHANLKFIDDGVGRILDALDTQGLRDNTIVVFTSDHGDFAGEHNMTCKGGLFYDCLTRVPLILSGPGIPKGIRDQSMANLVDIVPTLYRLVGIDIPRTMTGKPLPTITDEPPRTATFSEYGCGGPPFTMGDLARFGQTSGRKALVRSLNWREAEGRAKMVCTRQWKYVYAPANGADELYNRQNDPAEQTNLVSDPAYKSVVFDLRTKLLAWCIATEDAKPVPLP
ncbi:sulfatase [Planctomycetota bacterium]